MIHASARRRSVNGFILHFSFRVTFEQPAAALLAVSEPGRVINPELDCGIMLEVFCRLQNSGHSV